MSISNFEELLQTALEQPEPQRLLFLFAKKGVPEGLGKPLDSSIPNDSGGTLTPIMCVDKAPDALATFDQLVRESDAMGQHWDIVLVACMSGGNGSAPSVVEIDHGLETMLGALQHGGELSRFLAFDRSGVPLRFI